MLYCSKRGVDAKGVFMKKWTLRIVFLAIGVILAVAWEKGLLGNINPLQLIIVPTLIIAGFIGIRVIMIGRTSLKKEDFSYELQPLTTPIPLNVSDLHVELQSLGFTLFDELHVSNNMTWNYFNPDHDITAQLNQDGQVIFSSYFSDGLDVTTIFPSGMNINTDYIRTRIVESSITQAFDFHLHHTEQHMVEHGKLHVFSDFASVMEWNEQHKYKEAIQKKLSKFGLKIILIGVFFVFAAIFGTILIITSQSLVNLVIVLVICGIALYFSSVLTGTRKLTESVESRKKRKPKELERLETAQDEIYPS